ncbi:MAG: lipopolysaccharide heptosyltransferase II [Vicinamibacterales bacterium]
MATQAAMTGIESARRVVIRAPNWLGDAVLALPAMTALRKHFAHASITLAAPAAVAALFREDTGVRPDAVLVLPPSEREAVRAMRDGKFDLGVLFPNSFRSAWVLRRAGVRERWGMARGFRGVLLTRRSRAGGKGGHHADYYRALVRGLGIECDNSPPTLAVSETSKAGAVTLLSRAGVAGDARLIGVAPGAAYGQAKQWPPKRMAEVIARLVREHDATCLLVGAAHDRTAAREIESWLRSNAPDAQLRVIDFVGRTDLGSLVGLAAMCRVFVSNDSGAMHVAAALGTPVVAMFGPTDERATRPLGAAEVLTADVFCRPCHLRDCPIDHRCMKRIEVSAVFAATSRHLVAGGQVAS